jgi:hypothetical protein
MNQPKRRPKSDSSAARLFRLKMAGNLNTQNG